LFEILLAPELTLIHYKFSLVYSLKRSLTDVFDLVFSSTCLIITAQYKDGAWNLGGAQTPAGEEMRNILNAVGTVQFTNTSWGYQGAPNKGTVENKDISEEMVREDYRRFKDKFLSVPLSSLFNYYAAKGTYYIQIGGYGMYYMASNPANLPVPRFNGAMRLRIRLKRGGSTPIYNYRFTTALQVIQKPSKSKFNIDESMNFLVA